MERAGHSLLFTERKIGAVTIRNRFVRSATFESAANPDGTIGEEYGRIYERLSRGEIGLIVTGMISVNEEGKGYRRQASLHSDACVEAFAKMNGSVHENGSRIFAQLCHAGRQTMVRGRFPSSASWGRPDITYQVLSRPMKVAEIRASIRAFAQAANRARRAGFDGVQIHAAHGYLAGAFLSPFSNRRSDEWGGDSERRFRLLGAIYEAIRDSVGADFPVIAKINVADWGPGCGLGLDESAEHIGRLASVGIDAVEISCGTMAFSMFSQSRGAVPARELSRTLPLLLQPAAELSLRLAYPASKFAFHEGYNLWAAEKVRAALGGVPLIVVGGMRSPSLMETVVREGRADFISLCRPFIREPLLIREWSEGADTPPSCTNCNKCYAGLGLHEPLACDLNRRF
jgi:2,4-dienoyl-CoA reductase-like NADH-dependent reductase (Old Yellow Enzyme family)